MARLITKEQAKEFLEKNNYKSLEYLGQGAFSMVFKGENNLGDEVAVKVISDTSESAMDKELQSVRTIAQMRKTDNSDNNTKLFLAELKDAVEKHWQYKKHIVNPVIKSEQKRVITNDSLKEIVSETKSEKDKALLDNWWKDKQSNSNSKDAKTYILEAEVIPLDLERFTDKNNEGKSVRKLDFALVRKVAKGMLKTLLILHNKDQVHLDIKSDNVFASDRKNLLPKFKLGDYGNSTNDKEGAPDLSSNGHILAKLIPGFPQNYKENPPTIADLKKVDIYCVGMTIMEFYARRANEVETGQQLNGKYKIPSGKSYTIEEFKIAKEMLKKSISECTDNDEKTKMENLLVLIKNLSKKTPSERWSINKALQCDFLKKVVN